jgi:hypothetical protein
MASNNLHTVQLEDIVTLHHQSERVGRKFCYRITLGLLHYYQGRNANDFLAQMYISPSHMGDSTLLMILGAYQSCIWQPFVRKFIQNHGPAAKKRRYQYIDSECTSHNVCTPVHLRFGSWERTAKARALEDRDSSSNSEAAKATHCSQHAKTA